MPWFAALGVLALAVCGRAHETARPPVSEARVVAALYGEVCGESYACKLATAHALRNRMAWKRQAGAKNLLQGVYGAQSPLLKQPIDRRAWADCARAWRASATGQDPTGGAVFWACRSDLGGAYLRDGEFTVRVGGHWFYKRKGGGR